MPFPSARPIHDAWSAHHQPVATATLNGRLTISSGATGGGWDPASGPTPSTPEDTPQYDGPFRAQALDVEGQPQDAAGQTVTIRSYLLAIAAAAADIPVGARATVHACPDDTALVGKVFTITGTTYASRRFERDLYADLDLTNQGA